MVCKAGSPDEPKGSAARLFTAAAGLCCDGSGDGRMALAGCAVPGRAQPRSRARVARSSLPAPAPPA